MLAWSGHDNEGDGGDEDEVEIADHSVVEDEIYEDKDEDELMSTVRWW